MNKEDFSNRVTTVVKQGLFRSVVEQELSVMQRTTISSFVNDRQVSDDMLEYAKRRGESDIANILFGDIVDKLKALKVKYCTDPYCFSRDLISDIDEIIESIPQ